MTTPQRLKQWRGAKSQEAAARLLGVSLSSYIRWEAGKCEPRGLYAELVERTLATVTDQPSDIERIKLTNAAENQEGQ